MFRSHTRYRRLYPSQATLFWSAPVPHSWMGAAAEGLSKMPQNLTYVQGYMGAGAAKARVWNSESGRSKDSPEVAG